MRVWRSTDQMPGDLTASVTTVGTFDGVHLGHRHVIASARRTASEVGGLPTVVVTFDPHPMAVVRPDQAPAMLTTVDQRADLVGAAGADAMLVLTFDEGLARMPAEEFVRRVLVERLHAAAVVVGENFRFGHRAAGDVALLDRLGGQYGFRTVGLRLHGSTVPWSSTHIRGRLAAGDVSAAAQALGRPYWLDGLVVTGDRRGRALGYPTANVIVSGSTAVPADGVYAGRLRRLDGPDAGWLAAAISVGTNPTFDGQERRVEAYVLDRSDLELYDVQVRVSFVERLRGMVRFDSVDALVEQMGRDVDRARDLLGRL